jgi:hypothetical protein
MSPGIEIAMPISSNHLLVLYERTFHKDFEPYDNHILIHYDPQNVTYFNAMQVAQSYKSIFCSERQFALAEEMVNTDPELKQVNRQRLGFS